MQFQPTVVCALPVVLSISGLARPLVLSAQTQVTMRPSPVAAELDRRPGAAAENARLRVVPLEEAFLDAAIVKRRMLGRIAPAGR